MAIVLPRLVHERPDRPSIGARALLLRVFGMTPGGAAQQGYAPPPAPVAAATATLPLAAATESSERTRDA